MRIDTLKLANFRNFQEATFHFPTNFTVVIGENGKGKSSILQGLRLAAASFLLGVDEAERYHIQKEDIRRIDLENRFVPQRECSFSASGLVAGQQIRWSRKIASPGGRTDFKGVSELVQIARNLNDRVNVNLEEEVDLPVIGFFSTARLWADSKQTVQLKKKGSRLRDGYARCVDTRSDKESPMAWIKSGYWKKLKEKPESVLLDAVLEAIDTCIPNWKPTEWDEDTDDLGGIYTDENGKSTFVPLFFLSDGLRTMAAMVAEIAYRCVVLNAHYGANAVKQSKGIVLIDEIDMHLHPKWQRKVVQDLKTAFPHIQFVATTHSPFIVQSLTLEELINLDSVTEEDPQKLSIEDVASYVMQVGPRSMRFSQLQNEAETYLRQLQQLTNGKGAVTLESLEATEKVYEVNDPAFAAFLKMNRLAKLGNQETE